MSNVDDLTYDISNYAVANFDWTFVIYYNYNNDIANYKRDLNEQYEQSELKQWIDKNCNHNVYFKSNVTYNYQTMDYTLFDILLIFEDKNDMLLFKLTWSGNV